MLRVPSVGSGTLHTAPVFWRAQQLRPRWQSRPRFERAAFGCERDRIAEGSCPRGATRVARRARVRNATSQQSTVDRCLPERCTRVRLDDRRRNRHRRHFDEQRERARRRLAVAGRAEPGLNRPRRRSRPGGPHGGRQLIGVFSSSLPPPPPREVNFRTKRSLTTLGSWLHGTGGKREFLLGPKALF